MARLVAARQDLTGYLEGVDDRPQGEHGGDARHQVIAPEPAEEAEQPEADEEAGQPRGADIEGSRTIAGTGRPAIIGQD